MLHRCDATCEIVYVKPAAPSSESKETATAAAPSAGRGKRKKKAASLAALTSKNADNNKGKINKCFKQTSGFTDRTKENYLDRNLYGKNVIPDPNSLVLRGLPDFDIVHDIPIDTMHTFSVAANWILYKGLTRGRTTGRLDGTYSTYIYIYNVY